MRYHIPIRAGRFAIETRREDMPLGELLDYASRQNPKRGFLFVSKVLGKHIPCRPALMRHVYERLAKKLQPLPQPLVIIGMAETATGLGAGVAHSLARRLDEPQVLYLHTTRHPVDAPILHRFDETHSHAPGHLLYAPQGQREALFRGARSLVLVDDEISTGRTLKILAQGILPHLPQLQNLAFTAIVNWLQKDEQHGVQAGFQPVLHFASLVEGGFDFQPNRDYRPTLPPAVDGVHPSYLARADTGRTGLIMPTDIKPLIMETVPPGPLVVVGTGEFSFAPFLAAEALEHQGRDVLFQSTTRSPILEGEAVGAKLTFGDEYGEGVENYLYNLPRRRQVIVAYEQLALAFQHRLPALVDGHIWALAP